MMGYSFTWVVVEIFFVNMAFIFYGFLREKKVTLAKARTQREYEARFKFFTQV